MNDHDRAIRLARQAMRLSAAGRVVTIDALVGRGELPFLKPKAERNQKLREY